MTGRAVRVAMVAPYPPKLDGIGNHTRTLVGALEATGEVSVEVFAQRRPAGDEPGVHHVLSGLRSAGVARALHEARPDIIHVQFAIPALGPSAIAGFRAAARMRAEGGTRLVVTCHEVRRELDLLRGLGAVIYRRMVGVADLVVVHTDESRRLLLSECGVDPAKVVCMPLGVEPPAPAQDAGAVAERDALGLPARPFALSFGFLHPDKGVDVAIEAVARLRDRDGLDVDLVVAGAVRPRTGIFRWFERADHAHERDLRAAVERHGLGDRVRFVGFVPDDVIGELFRSARAVVMPCTTVTQSSVAGLTTAYGAPVVASDLPGLREAFDDAAVLVPVGDTDGFAAALGAVMGDDALASSLAAAQRRRAAAVAMPVVADTLVGCYRAVLGGDTVVREVAHG